MSKSFLLIYLFCLIFFNNNKAQAQVETGINLGIFKPLKLITEPQLGLNMCVKKNLNSQIRIGINVGYYIYTHVLDGKRLSYFSSPITSIIEFSFKKNKINPYVGADIGLYIQGASLEKRNVIDKDLGLSPLIGLDYKFTEKVNFNCNIKYHYIIKTSPLRSSLSINLGINYVFKKKNSEESSVK